MNQIRDRQKRHRIMSNKISTPFVCLCLLATLPVNGQVREIRNAPSAEVANLGTFGSVPVGNFTGAPNVTIPLYTLKAGNLTVPIEAIYHTSNVKPHMPPTSLGIGWAVSAGGYIARRVVGAQDEKETYTTKAGYYFNHGKVGQIDQSSDKSRKLKDLTHLSGNDWYELAADEFSFSFNGYSGTFFMDKDGEWRVVSDDNIRVEFNEASGFKTIDDLKKRFSLQYYGGVSYNKRFFDRFTLVTPDGTRYEFGGGNATEYSVPYYKQVNGDIMATCWRLSKITTTDQRVVTFDYAADSYMCDIHYAPQMITSYVNNKGYGVVHNYGRSGYSGFLTMPSRLTKITFDDETVTFKYDRDTSYGNLFLQNSGCLFWRDNQYDYRYSYGMQHKINDRRFSLFMGVTPSSSEDVTQNAIAKKITHDYLSGITVTKSGKVLDIGFGYKKSRNRRLLSTVRFSVDKMAIADLSDDAGQGYAYDLEYYLDDTQVNLWPARNALTYTDSWGYYSRYGSNPSNRGEWQLSKSYVESDFQLRYANLTTTLVYALKSIKYPTGGKTTLEYELNDYSKVFDIKTGTLKDTYGTAGGLRVKTLRNYGLSGKLLYSKNYIYKNGLNGKSSGISKGIPCFYDRFYFKEDKSEHIDFYSFDNMSPYPLNFNAPDVGYSMVFEEKLDASGNLLSRTKWQYTNYDSDTYGNAHRDAKADNTAYVYDSYASAPFTSMAFERGKPTVMEVRDADDNVIIRETYQYARTAGAPYTTVSHESYLRYNNDLFGCSYLYKTYTNKYLVSVNKRQEVLSGGTFNATTSTQYTSYGMPSLVRVTDNNGTSETTAYTYTFDDANYTSMKNDNILLPTLTTKTHNGSKTDVKTTYKRFGTGTPYVSSKETTMTLEGQQDKRTEFTVLRADRYGNPVEMVENGVRIILIWSYKGQRLVATVQGAGYDDVCNALNGTPESFSEMSKPATVVTQLREKLSGTLVFNYGYNYRLNLTSKTEPNGMTYLYKYDLFNRLRSVYRKADGRTELVKTYKYNYATQ